MSSLTLSVWMDGEPPNYVTNRDRNYAYSEVPYLGEYYLYKLPAHPDHLIYHVDYWGEGRIQTEKGISGFADCYNVNHSFKLVSEGINKGSKIPNRIPVESYTNCDTTSYINDDSVIRVTIMGASIHPSCAADIARMVHKNVGKVFAYGYDSNSTDIANLTGELKYKGINYCPGFMLPPELQGITRYDKCMAFLNGSILKDELVKLIQKASYANAVSLTKSLNNEISNQVIKTVIQRLFDINSKNIMSYAYKLWVSGAQDAVVEYFPVAFKVIFSESNVTIVNKEYPLAMALDENLDENEERRGWAVPLDEHSKRITWKLSPTWAANKVMFKVYNTESDMYLKFDNKPDNMADRIVFGNNSPGAYLDTFTLEPMMLQGQLVFSLIDDVYNQSLKLPFVEDEGGKRLLWGHNNSTGWGARIFGFQSRFRWIITAKE